MTAFARRPFSISVQAEKDRERPNILLASGKFENPREEVHARVRRREHQGKLNTLLQEQKDLRVSGTGDIFESYLRFGNRRDMRDRFREQGRYNPKYGNRGGIDRIPNR